MEKPNIPQLRFSEFKGEWEEISFKEIFKINQGLQIAISERLLTKEPNSEFYITNEFLKSNSEKKYYIKNPPKSVICNVDDILMTRTGNTGVVVTGVKGAFHNNFFKIAYPKTVNKDFLVNYLNLPSIQNLILKLAGTSTIPDLNHSDFYRINFVAPPIDEQQKIASFLSAVDKKIAQLQQKKQLLEQYKKSMMQKLFSQQLRFKDDNGNDYPEWEEKKLGEIYTFRATNSFSRANLNYEKGNVKNIHYGDIHTKFNSQFNVLNEEVPFINSDMNIEKIANDNYCKEGDLIIADASEDYNDIGKSIEVVNTNNEKIIAGLHTFLARPDLYNMAVGFGAYLMKSESIRKQIKLIAQGTKVLSISTTRLAGINMNVPSLKEQTKIASFLTAIDNKINAVSNEVEQAKAFKKGLLQQMFV